MLRLYLIALVSAFLVSLAATPGSIMLARRFGAMDVPDPRKVHLEPRPRWGGIGVVGAILAAIALLWLFIPEFENLLSFRHDIVHKGRFLFSLSVSEQLAGILFGVVVLFVLGLVDDRRPVKAGMKLTIQIIAAYVAMTYGVRIYGVSAPGFEAYALFPLWLMQIVTVGWLVGLSNAMNLIDGLDGLAAGVVAVVAGAFLSVTLIQGGGHSPLFDNQMRLAGVLAAALLGAVLGFLVYNVHPAQVFLGDSGSLTIGFLVAAIAVIGAFKTTILAVVLLPVFLVVVPVADMTVSFVRRLARRQSPFAPDRGHFHHRLLDAGWTQREVVFLIYVITLVVALVSITAIAMKRT